MATLTSTSALAEERPERGLECFKRLSEEYSNISDHEHLPEPSVMEAITTRTIPLLTADVKMRKFIAANREMMEETLKALNIGAKVMGRRSNAMWKILLATKGNCKSIGQQDTERQVSQTANRIHGHGITMQGVAMYITEEHLGVFFSGYCPMILHQKQGRRGY